MNLDNIVKAHNAKILKQEDESNENVGRSCNCRDKAACPVANNCLTHTDLNIHVS